jgi:hypothetical protein
MTAINVSIVISRGTTAKKLVAVVGVVLAVLAARATLL